MIDYNIWRGITVDQYKLWRRNFQTDEEKFLAACILDSLMYRSKDQTLAMLEDNIIRSIPNIFRLFPAPANVNMTFPDCLKDAQTDPKIRIVLTLRQKDDPTKGAHIIGRYYVKDFQIKAKYVIKPSDIDKAYVNGGVRTFIFVDDIFGTGSTFLDVYSECNINQMNDSYLIFPPLAIHEKSVMAE